MLVLEGARRTTSYLRRFRKKYREDQPIQGRGARALTTVLLLLHRHLILFPTLTRVHSIHLSK